MLAAAAPADWSALLAAPLAALAGAAGGGGAAAAGAAAAAAAASSLCLLAMCSLSLPDCSSDTHIHKHTQSVTSCSPKRHAKDKQTKGRFLEATGLAEWRGVLFCWPHLSVHLQESSKAHTKPGSCDCQVLAITQRAGTQHGLLLPIHCSSPHLVAVRAFDFLSTLVYDCGALGSSARAGADLRVCAW